VEAAARIAELEAKLARAAHERDEYRKLYELVLLELERVKRHLRAQNKSERVDPEQVQMAFRQVADLILPPALAEQIAASENEEREAEKRRHLDRQRRGSHGRNKLPEHLPVERIEIHPPETLRHCACCGKGIMRLAKRPVSNSTIARRRWCARPPRARATRPSAPPGVSGAAPARLCLSS
jgi:hypothetical protein